MEYEIKLCYKEHLENRIKSFVGDLYHIAVEKYLRELNVAFTDFYDAYYKFSNLKDEDYCGLNYNAKAKCYLLDKQGTLLWFSTMSDAMYFANYINGASNDYSIMGQPQDDYSFTDFFVEFRKRFRNGFYWLLPEDIADIDNILEQPEMIYCEDKHCWFGNMKDAVNWLVNSGAAANEKVAARQLQKNLDGQTSTCYGMKFIRC